MSLQASPTRNPMAPPGHNSALGSALVRNTASNFVGHFALMGLSFLAIPYLLQQLGSTRYGVLMLLLSFVNAFNLFQFGLNLSLVRYLAGSFEQGHTEDIPHYVGTALSLFLGAGLAAFAILAALADWLVVGFFQVPADLQSDAACSLYLAAAALLIRFVAESFAAVPVAAQRFHTVNLLYVGTECARMLGSVVAVHFGFRLKGVLAVTLLVNLLFLVGNMVAAKRLAPGLRLRPKFSAAHFWRVYPLAKFLGIAKLSSRISTSADAAILAYFLPVAHITFYTVPQSLCQKIGALIANIISASFPALGALAAAGSHDKLQELYLRSSKLVAVAASFPALVFCVLGGKLLLHWVGPELAEHGTLTLGLLSAGFLVNGLMHPADAVTQAIGHPEISAKVNVMHMLIYLGLCLILVPWLGTAGAATGFLATQLILAPWLLHTANRLLQVGWRDLLWNSYGPVLAPLGMGCMVMILFWPRTSSLLALATVCVAAMAVYLMVGAFFILDDTERAACFRFLKRPSS